MKKSINPGYAFCEKAGCNVRLSQSEGECREEHNCDDGACPLESELGQGRLGSALGLLAPGLLEGISRK